MRQVTDQPICHVRLRCINAPQIFYAYDLDKYGDELRGFYMDYKKRVARSNC
ncbi:CDP-glycerol glycerophosphotransferase family protein [Staphylococcus aureus]